MSKLVRGAASVMLAPTGVVAFVVSSAITSQPNGTPHQLSLVCEIRCQQNAASAKAVDSIALRGERRTVNRCPPPADRFGAAGWPLLALRHSSRARHRQPDTHVASWRQAKKILKSMRKPRTWAYNADLPGGWEIFFDEEGNHFYFDSKKQISTYTHPSIDYYRKLYKDFKKKDQEFREQQERREIAFGLRDEETADKGKGRKSTAGSREGSKAGSRAVSPERQDDILSAEESIVEEEKEGLAKTRLLQAYSHDP
eukprot:1062373-Rhodomonas_salina.2